MRFLTPEINRRMFIDMWINVFVHILLDLIPAAFTKVLYFLLLTKFRSFGNGPLIVRQLFGVTHDM